MEWKEFIHFEIHKQVKQGIVDYEVCTVYLICVWWCIAPHIEEFPENTTAIEGEEVIFKVVVSGKPTPTLTWKSAGKELFSNYAMIVGDDGTLTFPSSEMDQSGVYVMEARNSAGKTDREVKLHIEKEGDDGNSNAGKENLNISAIPVDQFGEYVAENHSSNNRGFRDQFQVPYNYMYMYL